MQAIMTFNPLRRFVPFIRDLRGATAIEYALVAIGVAVSTTTAVATLGDDLGRLYGNVATEIAQQRTSQANQPMGFANLVAAMRLRNADYVERWLAEYRSYSDENLQANHATFVRGFERRGGTWRHDTALIMQEVLDERGLEALNGRIERP